MAACDDTKIARISTPSRLVTALLVLLAQVVAALLIGSVALAIGPVQAADAPPAAFANPGDAGLGPLLQSNGDMPR
jgi:hypothetical protein